MCSKIVGLVILVVLSFVKIGSCAATGSDITEMMNHAKASLHSNEYVLAAQIYRSVIDLYPNDVRAPEAAMALGNCYRKLNYIDSAIATFKYLLTVYPSSREIPQAEYSIACCLMSNGNVESAIRQFDEIVGKYPRSSLARQAQMWIGHLNHRLAHSTHSKNERPLYLTEAGDAFKKAMKLFPSNSAGGLDAEFMRTLVSCSMAHTGKVSWNDVESQAQGFLEKHPNASSQLQARLQLLLVESAMGRKNYQTAAERAEKAIELSAGCREEQISAHIIGANAYEKLGNYASVLDHLSSAIDAHRIENASRKTARKIELSCLMKSAECYIKLVQVDRAIRIWQSVIAEHPNGVEAKRARSLLAKFKKDK